MELTEPIQDLSLNIKINVKEVKKEFIVNENIKQFNHGSFGTIPKIVQQKRFEILNDSMFCLTDREKEVIKARRLSEPPKRLEAIAAEMSLTKQRVHQIELTAFKKLKTEINKWQSVFECH